MEACATAHYWGRLFMASGRQVRLINPHFVKPFVRGSKNDAVDAEAIFDAASRPTMRFVPVKTEAQQDLQSLHRVRDRLVAQRTSLINHLRGLLAEYGLVYPKGAALLLPRIRSGLSDAGLSAMAFETFEALLDELGTLEGRIKRLDKRLADICREDAMSSPDDLPASVRSFDCARRQHWRSAEFRSGREMAHG
jgi:transposase